MKQFRIRKNDKVMIIAGKDKGKIGAVLKVLRKKDAVLIEKMNVAKRHTKGNPYQQRAGGIVEKEMPIDISNVMLVCSACAKPCPAQVGSTAMSCRSKVSACGTASKSPCRGVTLPSAER